MNMFRCKPKKTNKKSTARHNKLEPCDHEQEEDIDKVIDQTNKLNERYENISMEDKEL